MSAKFDCMSPTPSKRGTKHLRSSATDAAGKCHWIHHRSPITDPDIVEKGRFRSCRTDFQHRTEYGMKGGGEGGRMGEPPAICFAIEDARVRSDRARHAKKTSRADARYAVSGCLRSAPLLVKYRWSQ
jgi:hypothetical protein